MVLQLVPRAAGGMRRHVLALVRELAHRGWNLAVAGAVDRGWEEACREMGVPCVPLPEVAGRDPVSWRRAGAGLSRLCAQWGVKIVHAHGLRAGLAALRAARSVAVIYTVHGFPQGPVARALERRVVRGADAVLAVSSSLAEAYRSLRPDVRVIPGGVDPARFSPAVPPSPSWEGVEGGPRLGLVARLSPEKGVDVALRALPLLTPRFPRAALYVAGDGPQAGYLAGLARRLGVEERVRFLGRVEDVPGFLRGLDLYLQPSRREGQGLAVLEAMACGIPVVGSAVGGLGEILAEGRGIAVPPGDPRRLADAVSAALAAPEEARERAQRALAYTLGRTEAALAAEVERIYMQQRPGWNVETRTESS